MSTYRDQAGQIVSDAGGGFRHIQGGPGGPVLAVEVGGIAVPVNRN